MIKSGKFAILKNINYFGRQMKAVKILAPFGLSTVLFILAYLSSRDTSSGLFPIMLFGIGVLIAFVGVAAIFSGEKGQ